MSGAFGLLAGAFSKKPLSTDVTRLDALQLQSSAYGVTKAIVHGTIKISGNLLDYRNFQSHAHSESVGGKGGGGGTTVTSYTYSADVVMGLADCKITAVPTVWRGNEKFSNAPPTASINNATDIFTLVDGVHTYTLSHPADQIVRVYKRAVTESWPSRRRYYLSRGAASTAPRDANTYKVSGNLLTVNSHEVAPWVDGGLTELAVEYQYLSVIDHSALSQVGLSLFSGDIGQAVWSALTGTGHDIGYSGLAYLGGQNYDLGGGATLQNHNFEVVGPLAYTISGIKDAVPADSIVDWITNPRYSIGITQHIEVDEYRDYCIAAGLFMSPALTEQRPLADVIKDMVSFTNSEVVCADSTIYIVPLGDETITGNGVTYTPDLTPIFDLTPDQFLLDPNSGKPAVRVTRKSPKDAYNSVRVEYLNRAKNYDTDVAYVPDQAYIDSFGEQAAPTINAHWITEATVAHTVARLQLNRYLSILNTYEFELPWNFAELLPTNLVTLTDPAQGLDHVPVRITKITENQDGYTITAEDFPAKVASIPEYALQVSDPYTRDYNVDPGDASAPVFIEPPVDLTSTGLEVWIAATGTGDNWGGCYVYVSLDGTNYKQLGQITRGSRYGTLTASMSAIDSSVNVQIVDQTAQLLSGSSADASALNTLCWVYGPGEKPEFFAYTNATLTGAGAYTLDGLVRGAYSSGASAHASGAAFARLDTSRDVVKSDPMSLDMIGRTIYVKLVSFNIYGAGVQDISTVPEYSYTITGAMAQLPPPNFDRFTVQAQPDGTRNFDWAYTTTTRPPDLKGARIRYAAGTVTDWNAMTPLDTDGGFFSASPHESNQLLAGTYTFAIRAEDQLGNLSETILYDEADLPDPRLGNAIDAFYPDQLNWPGTLTNCVNIGGVLEALDSTTWDTPPAATWDAWTRWVVSPSSSFIYEHTAFDIGFNVAFNLVTQIKADGTVLVEQSTSTDGVTYTGWSTAGSATTARYVKIRITVTATTGAPFARLFSAAIYITGKTVNEYINDLDPTTLTGAQRIGSGDIRLPLSLTFNVIKRVGVTLQSVTGNWSWTLLDKDTTNGPHIRIYNASGALADPPLIDAFIEGI